MNWEYFVANISVHNGSCISVTKDKLSPLKYDEYVIGKDEQDVLTFLGDRGWELVNIFQGHIWFDNDKKMAKCFYFKRPK